MFEDNVYFINDLFINLNRRELAETWKTEKQEEVNKSVIHDTSVEQSKTGNPSIDATWDTCKL